jgi:hypothetical protein
MLVTFHTKAYGDITMFGDVAVRLLRLMGHSGTVPSAIEPADIPAALQRLRSAIRMDEAAQAQAPAPEDQDDDKERAVSLKNRAYPLIQLLEAAARDDMPVMWDA